MPPATDPETPPIVAAPPTRTPVAPWRIWLARGIAVAADVVQVVLIPNYALDYIVGDVVDVIAAGLLTLLVGWRLAFIPSFLIRLIPVADLAPTWTIAIAIATWPKKSQPAKVEKSQVV
jgi:hypothetical protein